MTAIELLTALLTGTNLIRYNTDRTEHETFWCEWNKDKPYFYVHGWGSALGTAKDRLIDVIENPQYWEIEVKNILPDTYPQLIQGDTI